ncbi:hypothetical protein RIF29_35761 [Crotalaria pallida]|uniref:Uncharacterized protein n=1 Tax=Crotalaria pallida TaxID=3830 RepID=A0AAN9EAR7_CROPI
MSSPIVPTPLVQQPTEMTHHSDTTHPGHGSVGPAIAVIAVILVLGIIAGFIGRLCSGRRVMGRGGYDMERWVETKCSSCLDGGLAPPPPPAPPVTNAGEGAPPVVGPQEGEQGHGGN